MKMNAATMAKTAVPGSPGGKQPNGGRTGPSKSGLPYLPVRRFQQF